MIAKTVSSILCAVALGQPAILSKSRAENRFHKAIVGTEQKMLETLNKIEETKPKTNLERADIFAAQGVRSTLFQLQALGRMYRKNSDKKIAKFAKALRDDTQDLEDKLGRIDMLKTVGRTADAEAAAKKLFAEMPGAGWVAGKGLGPKFTEWEDGFREIEWPKNSKDDAFVFETARDQLEKLIDSDYDMNLLEGGLHELRRELRWWLLYVQSADGLIQKSNVGEFACADCAQPFTDSIDPRYTAVPANPNIKDSKICYISATAFDQIVGAVGAFGKLKDRAELIVEHDDATSRLDQTPADIAADGRVAYQKLKDSKLLQKLRKQLKDCM
jgi:hypothetical protein